MSRKPRIDYPGAWQHVFHHAIGDEALFHDDDDCIEFLGIVETASRRFHLEVHGYALIPNHYHLLLRSMTGDLSRGMRIKKTGSQASKDASDRPQRERSSRVTGPATQQGR